MHAAEAIIKAVESKTPPFRLALGHLAIELIGAELDEQRRELDAWTEVGAAADFPK